MVLGPIESTDETKGTISVLGRRFQIPAAAARSQILDRHASGESLQIAVSGTVSKVGKIRDLTIQVVPSPYVAGVSEVVLTGVVQAMDRTTGQAVVNGIAVSYTSLLETKASTANIGDVITVRGTMAQTGQAIDASVMVIHGR